MEVITTHVNADFDCLASLVAAKKIYPEARVVLSGSAERTVHEYLKHVGPAIEIDKIKHIDFGQVTRLIIVDTQDCERIGDFKSLVGQPQIEIHIYDHHPDCPGKIKADRAVIRKRGAATTILCEILSEKNLALTPEECTLMVLGIFQDTASMLSSSTTAEDFAAVSHLVEQGANLNTVSEFLHCRLNQEQLNVLNDLISDLQNHLINGMEIAIATASADHFVEDLAQVVHGIMDMENLSVLFALIRLDQRVYLICRSRSEGVNVAEVAHQFGGGGHAQAASATIRDQTLVQVREKLMEILNNIVRPLHLVRDIMHSPVVSVSLSDTVQLAEKTMTRFNLNTLPVLSGEKAVGLITRQTVEKAIHHKMGKEPVDEFMVRDFAVTTQDSFFKTIIPVIIEEKQKLVPVVHPDSGHLTGIVSRGDLLRVLYGDLVHGGPRKDSPLEGARGAAKSVKSLMKERLDKNVLDFLKSIAAVADRGGFTVYAVGGFVRDLLLGIENKDIDIVAEGDGIKFAELLGLEFGGKVKSHAKFATSVVILKDGSRIDVATARMEYYKHPAALPTVEISSIKSDLFRRDFTINSLAVKLNGDNAFCLIDHFNSEKDIKDKVIRVLHNLSFIEDPCRLFRAIRFEQRFGFRIGKQTEAFLKNAIKRKLVDHLSGWRLTNELILLLKENDPMSCIRRMQGFSLLNFISPQALQNPRSLKTLDRIEGVLSWSRMVPMNKTPDIWYIYFLGLLYDLDDPAFQNTVKRLSFPARLGKRLSESRESLRATCDILSAENDLKPDQVYDIFSGLSAETTIYLLARVDNDRANKYATLYLTQYHSQGELALTGDDLIRMGVQPGPVFQKVFKTLRTAKVNGEIKSRKEEIALVEKQFLQ